MPEFMDLEKLVSTFVIPWGINILLALATFFVGRWVANILLKVVKKLLAKSKMDVILINFVTSILHAVLLLFIVIAAMDQLGVDTTSLIACWVPPAWLLAGDAELVTELRRRGHADHLSPLQNRRFCRGRRHCRRSGNHQYFQHYYAYR